MKLTLFNLSLGGFLNQRANGGRLTSDQLASELSRLVRLGQMTAEQADDELERLTGCRFGDAMTCKCPDCKHNQN